MQSPKNPHPREIEFKKILKESKDFKQTIDKFITKKDEDAIIWMLQNNDQDLDQYTKEKILEATINNNLLTATDFQLNIIKEDKTILDLQRYLEDFVTYIKAPAMFGVFVKNGFDINRGCFYVKSSSSIITPLTKYSIEGKLDFVKVLIEKLNADVNIKNTDPKYSALEGLIGQLLNGQLSDSQLDKYIPIIKYLITNGAIISDAKINTLLKLRDISQPYSLYSFYREREREKEIVIEYNARVKAITDLIQLGSAEERKEVLSDLRPMHKLNPNLTNIIHEMDITEEKPEDNKAANEPKPNKSSKS